MQFQYNHRKLEHKNNPELIFDATNEKEATKLLTQLVLTPSDWILTGTSEWILTGTSE